jgi:hypothetical protein
LRHVDKRVPDPSARTIPSGRSETFRFAIVNGNVTAKCSPGQRVCPEARAAIAGRRNGEIDLWSVRGDTEIGESGARKTSGGVALNFDATEVYTDRMRLVVDGVLDGSCNCVQGSAHR